MGIDAAISLFLLPEQAMRPLLDKLISLRVSEEEYKAHRRAAAVLGVSPSEYLRMRIASASDEYVADQIAQLRLTLMDNLTPSGPGEGLLPILLEILLLLRQACSPEQLRSAQTELQRLGHSPWSAAANESP